MYLDKEQFFKDFPVEEYFLHSGLEWNVLNEIYSDFCNRFEEFNKKKIELRDYLQAAFDEKKIKVHSVSLRVKNAEHLIEKIIRKAGKEHKQGYVGINKNNYYNIVHDLIGARVLLLYKEEWENVYHCLAEAFPNDKKSDICMAEKPVAYAKYGDRDIYGSLIHKEHTNKGYRSQHYVISYNGYFCEIQVRTLAEEVFGEFDHLVKYPYRDNNRFLQRYSKSLSDLLDSVDEIISTCITMDKKGWDQNDAFFEGDQYIDWQHVAQFSVPEKKVDLYDSAPSGLGGNVLMQDYSKNILVLKRKVGEV